MAKTKIPRSARKSLKKALLEDGGRPAVPSRKAKQETRKNIRQGIRDGEFKRTKITWTVDVGNLVKIKASQTRAVSKNYNSDSDIPVYGIVTYKHNRITYNNQEDEYIVVMTPHSSELKIHPKQVELIQD